MTDRVFVRFTAFSFRFGIFVPITNKVRVKRKFSEKIAKRLRGSKKSCTFAAKIGFCVWGERSPIKQPSAGGLSFFLFPWLYAVTLGGEVARLFFEIINF